MRLMKGNRKISDGDRGCPKMNDSYKILAWNDVLKHILLNFYILWQPQVLNTMKGCFQSMRYMLFRLLLQVKCYGDVRFNRDLTRHYRCAVGSFCISLQGNAIARGIACSIVGSLFLNG